MEKTALDRYEGIVADALKYGSAKLRKSFKTAIHPDDDFIHGHTA
jgi:hypothetical protein